ncbi:folate family ECF transporter S component, partial [Lactobacillus jensenii]
MNKYKDNFFKLSLQNLVLLGLVIAIKLCLSSVAIGPAFFKIGLAFLGSVALGYLFGPVWGGLGGLVSSLLHLIIFGDKANVLLGTMLSAILVPMIYGFFFYNKEVKIWRVVMGHLTVTILINIMLNNYLFSLVSGVSLQVAFIQRLPKEV